MTIEEMSRRYSYVNHLTLYKGSYANIGVLLPFFIMDAADQYYRHDILTRRGEFSSEVRNFMRKWNEAYQSFRKRLTSCYTDEQKPEVTDLMDEMEDALANDLLIVQVQGMRCFEDQFDFEQQKVLSSLMMANLLSRMAQDAWAPMYGKESNEINGCSQWSFQMAGRYMFDHGARTQYIGEGKVEQLYKCCKIVVDKIIGWVRGTNSAQSNIDSEV